MRPAWSLLLVLRPRFAGRLRQNSSLSDENHVFAAELLLQFAHKPGLDFLVQLQLWHRYKDDDGLFALHINFLTKRNLIGKS